MTRHRVIYIPTGDYFTGTKLSESKLYRCKIISEYQITSVDVDSAHCHGSCKKCIWNRTYIDIHPEEFLIEEIDDKIYNNSYTK